MYLSLSPIDYNLFRYTTLSIEFVVKDIQTYIVGLYGGRSVLYTWL